MSNKLPLKDVLKQIDFKNFDFYQNLSDDEKKEFQPYVLMRFIQSGGNDTITNLVQLMAVNEIINKYFWDLSKEKELQVRLLYSCGLDQSVFHKWIPNKKDSMPECHTFIKNIYYERGQQLNDDEVCIILSKIGKTGLENMCDEYGIPDDHKNKIVKQYRI